MENGVFARTDVSITNGKISSVGPDSGTELSENVIDLRGKYVIPGLVDIHIHGAMGADFSDGAIESIHTISGYLIRHGVTSFLATSMSLPEDALSRCFSLVRHAIDEVNPARATLQGINMEGPFLSREKRGAQKAEYISAPDGDMFERLNQASGGHIRLVDVAPELPGALEFIAKASTDCTVSLAHTNADYDTASAAFSAGAKHATHLFNGMSAYSHRQPGVVGAALDHAAHAELICDGRHVHPSLVRMAFSVLAPERICLISDSMRACGMPDGQYDLGGQTVTVANKLATIQSGSLAGSVSNLFECMNHAISFGIPKETAILAATRNPAVAIGKYDQIGSISPNKTADLLVLNQDFSLSSIIHHGVFVNRAADAV
jgi:N-acetylglucosamine-6-phosphate deacetylase